MSKLCNVCGEVVKVPARGTLCRCADCGSKLSDRIRPNSEAAPWVIEAVRKLESDLDDLKATAQKLYKGAFEQQERVQLLERGIASQNQEIEQMCGRALGYPWYKDDQKNFPGSTDADGVCVGEHVAETVVAELVGKYNTAQKRIKRLVDAGDRLYERCDSEEVCEEWTASKEGL